jgi:hypothetical protein
VVIVPDKFRFVQWEILFSTWHMPNHVAEFPTVLFEPPGLPNPLQRQRTRSAQGSRVAEHTSKRWRALLTSGTTASQAMVGTTFSGSVAFVKSWRSLSLETAIRVQAIVPMVLRKRAFAMLKKVAPIAASARNCGQTISRPADR